ncbi:MAG: AI-2E family transporter [Actinomycetota bacterium]
MGTDSTSRTLLLLVGLALLAGCVWLVRDVLPPFLIALALALLLDPLLDRMQRAGLPRWAAAGITFLAFTAALFGAVAVLLPIAVAQIGELIRNFPTYAGRLQAGIDDWALQNSELLRRLNLPPSVNDLWGQYQRELPGYLQLVLERVFASLQASAGMFGWLVVVPIVTLYLLVDLDALQARISYLIPDRQRGAMLELAAQVGRVFGAYLRGLTALCLCFGVTVYLVLALVFGLPYALILGLSAVVLYAVPYLGQFTLLAAGALVAWVTGRSPAHIVLVAVALVVVGQIYDQLITPRVIGKQVGLHPVLGLFALMVGGQLLGPLGMIIAVPVAASVRVVLIQLFPRLAEPIPAPEAVVEPQTTAPPPVLADKEPSA